MFCLETWTVAFKFFMLKSAKKVEAMHFYSSSKSLIEYFSRTYCNLYQRWTTFMCEGPQLIIFSALKGWRQNCLSRIKKLNFTSFFIACGLILLQSQLFWIVISCEIANSSMKFKFIHKISVIQETFLVFFTLLWGPDKTPSGARSSPRAVHLWDIGTWLQHRRRLQQAEMLLNQSVRWLQKVANWWCDSGGEIFVYWLHQP